MILRILILAAIEVACGSSLRSMFGALVFLVSFEVLIDKKIQKEVNNAIAIRIGGPWG